MNCSECKFGKKERFFQAATGGKLEIERFSIICQRFPTPVKKQPDDQCGEFEKKKEEENEN